MEVSLWAAQMQFPLPWELLCHVQRLCGGAMLYILLYVIDLSDRMMIPGAMVYILSYVIDQGWASSLTVRAIFQK